MKGTKPGQHPLRGPELGQRLLEPAAREPYEGTRVVDDLVYFEFLGQCRRGHHTVQPPLGLVEPAEPRERGCTSCHRRSDEAVVSPSVRLGDRHRFLAQTEPDGSRRAAQAGREREVGQAADLQVQPGDVAG